MTADLALRLRLLALALFTGALSQACLAYGPCGAPVPETATIVRG